MSYIVLVRRETDGGFSGECPELPGCFGFGGSVDSLMDDMRDAVQQHLKDGEEILDPVYEVRELIL